MGKILITGGTGLLGTQLTALLHREGYDVWHLSRNPRKCKYKQTYYWNVDKLEIDSEALLNTEYIIHLAGAGIVEKKWTKEYKQQIIDSRVKSQEILWNACIKNNIHLKGYFSASGINYYGADTGEKINTEYDKAGTDFIAQVVVEWEEAALQFQSLCRVACFRFGIILDKHRGALPKLALPSKLFAAAALGSGKQFVPWIHVKDAANIFLHAVKNNHVEGIYNATAAQHISNKQLIKAIDKHFYNCMFLPNVPAFLLKLLLGERSKLVLGSVKADNSKLINSGFEFEFKSIENALTDIYDKTKT
jgi:uncharacterized protein (TIGR01777 family)